MDGSQPADFSVAVTCGVDCQSSESPTRNTRFPCARGAAAERDDAVAAQTSEPPTTRTTTTSADATSPARRGGTVEPDSPWAGDRQGIDSIPATVPQRRVRPTCEPPENPVAVTFRRRVGAYTAPT